MLKKQLIFLLLLLPVLFSASNSVYMDFFEKYFLPATILLVSALFGLLWALSDLFSEPKLKAWVRVELKNFISAGILTIMVYVLFFGTNNMVFILTGNPDAPSYAISQVGKFASVMEDAYGEVLTASHYLGVISGFGYVAPTFVYFFSFNFTSSPHSGVSALNSMLFQAAGLLSQSLFIYYSIIVLLEFFGNVIPRIILPISLSLCFIPFTRKIGATLVALCIGAALIFPVAVFFTSYFHGIALEGMPEPKLDMGPFKDFSYPLIAWFCGSGDPVIEVAKVFTQVSDIGWSLIAGMICCLAATIACFAAFVPCFNITWSVIYPMANGAYQAEFWAIALADYNSFFGDLDVKAIYDSIASYFRDVTAYVLMSYIDAILILLITITGTKSVSSAISGETYLFGIQRFL